MGTTAEKLQRILQTKDEQRDFLKTVSGITDDTPFKDYLAIIRQLVLSTYMFSTPLTSPKMNYSALPTPPKNVAISYNNGFQARNVLGVQNVATQRDGSSSLSTVTLNFGPSYDDAFSTGISPMPGWKTYVQRYFIGYYAIRFEYETDEDFGVIDAYDMVIIGTANSLRGPLIVITPEKISSYHVQKGRKHIWYQIIQVNNSYGSSISLAAQITFIGNSVKGKAISMYSINLGDSPITAEQLAKQYPTYFSNTAHSKFSIKNKSHNILTNTPIDDYGVSGTTQMPFLDFEVGQPLSAQAKVKVGTTTTSFSSTPGVQIAFQQVDINGNYSTKKFGNLIPIGEEGITKVENYVPDSSVAQVRILIIAQPYNQADYTYDYSDFQVEVSEKCNEYSDYFEEDLGTYELTGEEEERAFERYCLFEPRVGGYLQFDAVDNQLIPQLNTSTLDYFRDLTTIEISNSLTLLNSKEEV